MLGAKEGISATGDDGSGMKMERAEGLRVWRGDGFDVESERAVIASVTFAGLGGAFGFIWCRWELEGMGAVEANDCGEGGERELGGRALGAGDDGVR